MWQAALQAIEHIADPFVRTRTHQRLGHAYSELGQHEAAIEHLQQALAIAELSGDLTQQAHAHRQFMWACERRGDRRQALHDASLARDLYRSLDTPIWEAEAVNEMGWYAAHLGEYESARAHCKESLALHRLHGNRGGEGATLDSLGYIEHHTGQYREAVDYYRKSLNIVAGRGQTHFSAIAFDHLGESYAALGESQQARASWREALVLYQQQERSEDAERIQRQLDDLNSSED